MSGPKKPLLLDLCQCFQPYMMKYLVMICRGHVPVYNNRVNKDVAPFIKYFLPRGSAANKQTMLKVVRHLHLAFSNWAFSAVQPDEVYDVLMEQMVRAIRKYDPGYTDKVRLVTEAIDNEFITKQKQFSSADLNRYLEFDSSRYLRLLGRRGFLTSYRRAANRKRCFTDALSRAACVSSLTTRY